jgi:hypothetical protein
MREGAGPGPSAESQARPVTIVCPAGGKRSIHSPASMESTPVTKAPAWPRPLLATVSVGQQTGLNGLGNNQPAKRRTDQGIRNQEQQQVGRVDDACLRLVDEPASRSGHADTKAESLRLAVGSGQNSFVRQVLR